VQQIAEKSRSQGYKHKIVLVRQSKTSLFWTIPLGLGASYEYKRLHIHVYTYIISMERQTRARTHGDSSATEHTYRDRDRHPQQGQGGGEARAGEEAAPTCSAISRLCPRGRFFTAQVREECVADVLAPHAVALVRGVDPVLGPVPAETRVGVVRFRTAAGPWRCGLAFTRYCHHQYCMVYGIKRGGGSAGGGVHCPLVVQ